MEMENEDFDQAVNSVGLLSKTLLVMALRGENKCQRFKKNTIRMKIISCYLYN